MLFDSGVAEMLDKALPTAGPRRQLGAHTVLVGLLLSVTTAKVAHLTSGYRALCDLPISDQLRLGVGPTHSERAARGQLPAVRAQLLGHDGADRPKPCALVSGCGTWRASTALGKATQRGRVRRRTDHVVALTDAILEASVPKPHRARRCLAVDWTDRERPGAARKTNKSGQISADPDAAWGHAKRNAPGAKDGLFFGYYAQVVVMAPEEGSKGRP